MCEYKQEHYVTLLEIEIPLYERSEVQMNEDGCGALAMLPWASY